MFTVVIQALAESSQELQQSVKVVNRQLEEAERVLRSLRHISEYDEIRHILKNQLEQLQAQKKQLMDMMIALNQVYKMYQLCERNITDYGDQVMRYHRKLEVVSLGEIQEAIREYRIR